MVFPARPRPPSPAVGPWSSSPSPLPALLLALYVLLLAAGAAGPATAATAEDFLPLAGTTWRLEISLAGTTYARIKHLSCPGTPYFNDTAGDTVIDCQMANPDGSSAVAGTASYNPAGRFFNIFFPAVSGYDLLAFDTVAGVAKGYLVEGYDISTGNVSSTAPLKGEWLAPLAARFTAVTGSGTALTGAAPLAVRFYDASEGLVTGHSWDFGDGATATEADPVHVYTTPGTYTVRLTVSNDQAQDTATREGLVRVLADGSPAPAPGAPYLVRQIWPALQQPWYFSSPRGLAADSRGNVYVAEGWNHRISKWTADGRLITNFGRQGNGPGEFDEPTGLAVDSSDNLYVVDRKNHRIQKFGPHGVFLLAWGEPGTGRGQLQDPIDIAADGRGTLFVTDKERNAILSFGPGGTLLAEFGAAGSGPGQFQAPQGIAAAGDSLYVVDSGNHRIQKLAVAYDENGVPALSPVLQWGGEGDSGKGLFRDPANVSVDPAAGRVYVTDYTTNLVQVFDTNGTFVTQWGGPGAEDGRFQNPIGVLAVAGRVLVGEFWGHRIQAFTPDGTFLTRWSAWHVLDGFLQRPYGLALGKDGNLYVADTANDRIEVFGPDGAFVRAWGGKGTAAGEFDQPWALAVTPGGDIVVADTGNHRVQRFRPDGTFVRQWGGAGAGDGLFQEPRGIAVCAADGSIYVADTGNHRIQKFDKDGNFLGATTTGYGTQPGRFDMPQGLATDAECNVYVADSGNSRIQKLAPDGTLLAAWGRPGAAPGAFGRPYGLALGANGHLYVADPDNERIQEFTPDGTLVNAWGSKGTGAGQFRFPTDVAVGGQNRVFVLEHLNHRVQVFEPAAGKRPAKAIIVAGGGNAVANTLWTATAAAANFAYRSLAHRGLAKERIFYLSPDQSVDLDDNGLADDVDGDATLATLDRAFAWAADAADLVVYLVDHGGSGVFRMNGTELLPASRLDQYLDAWQQATSGRVTVVVDTCRSGSLLAGLAPAANRLVLTSTAADENAYFLGQGLVSFSNFFWSRVFNGQDVAGAFTAGSQGMAAAAAGRQTPQLDGNGNGNGNETNDTGAAEGRYLGSDATNPGAPPAIATATATVQADGALRLEATATDDDGIGRVWAVLLPPGFQPASSRLPVQDLPQIDLQPAGNGRFTATWNHPPAGTSTVAIYALDRLGNPSPPRTLQVEVAGSATRPARAILMTLLDADDPRWPAATAVLAQAHAALVQQGYADSDIRVLAPAAIGAGRPADGPATWNGLGEAITTWAGPTARDLLVALVGGDAAAARATDLDSWLDSAQQQNGMVVTVLLDLDRAGSLLPILGANPPAPRIVIAGATVDQRAMLQAGGGLSFSGFFWQGILVGRTVGAAFAAARQAVIAANREQAPLLDDNGNGQPLEAADGKLAAGHRLGLGIGFAADQPQAAQQPADQVLAGTATATISSGPVTASSPITAAWAVVTPPGFDPDLEPAPPQVPLTVTSTNAITGNFDGFTAYGDYQVAMYVRDEDGGVTRVASLVVRQNGRPDRYENDDLPAAGHPVNLNGPVAEAHNFHDPGDTDWVVFYGLEGEKYVIEATGVEAKADVVLDIFSGDGARQLTDHQDPAYTGDENAGGGTERITWTCPASGLYAVRVSNKSGAAGTETGYRLRVYRPVAPGQIGVVTGIVKADKTFTAVAGAVVTASNGGTAVSGKDGSFVLRTAAGTLDLSAFVPGKENSTAARATGVDLPSRGATQVGFTLPNPDYRPTATVSGVPAAPTYARTVTLTVGGAGIVAYSYRLGDGPFSDERPASEPLTVHNPDRGPVTVTLRGRDGNGNWQPADSPTTVAIPFLARGDLDAQNGRTLADAILLARFLANNPAATATLHRGGELTGDNRLGPDDLAALLALLGR